MLSATCTRRNHHVLIVEPNPPVRLLLCMALAGEFSDFHAVATFNEARALLAEHPFSAVIAADELKDGSGLALHNEVRRTQPGLPFVLMGDGIEVSRDEDLRFRYFAKPFRVTEMAAALLEMIDPAASAQ